MASARHRRVVLLAAIAIVSALAGAALLDEGGGVRERRPTRESGPIRATTPRATVMGRERPMRSGRSREGARASAATEDLRAGAKPDPGTRAAVRSAARVARRFIAALLRFEAEGATPGVTRGLGATAMPGFARFLLRREPRRPLGHRPPQRGRLVALEPLPARSAGRLEFAARIARGRGETGLIVLLRRAGGKWWVATLR